MSDRTDDAQIVVNENTLPVVAGTAIRYAVTTLGAFAVGKGWLGAEDIEGILALLIVISTVGYGIYKSRQRQKNLVITAKAAPDAVARVE